MSIPFHFEQEGLRVDCDDLIPLLFSMDEKTAHLAVSIILCLNELDILTPEQKELWTSKREVYLNLSVSKFSDRLGKKVKERSEDSATSENEKKLAEAITPVISQLPDIFKALFSTFNAPVSSAPSSYHTIQENTGVL